MQHNHKKAYLHYFSNINDLQYKCLLLIFVLLPSINIYAESLFNYQHLVTNSGIDADVIQINDMTKLHLFLRDPVNGKVFSSFSKLQQSLDSCQQLEFAMNAGMYHADRQPVGLYIEKSIQYVPLNQIKDFGNFFIQPNGVLLWNDQNAKILPTAQYSSESYKPLYATQSGPMLLINGQINSNFLKDSTSLKIRNGVGIKDNHLYFVITRNRVNFYNFAEMFRKEFDIKDALYLDGSISSLFLPQIGRNDDITRLGPMIALIDDSACH